MTDNNIIETAEPLIEAAERLKRNELFAIVTVISDSGSTPRKTCSRMLVSPDGDVFGSVGGGSVEKLSVEAALKSLGSGRIERIKMALSEGDGIETGMVCGGQMEMLVEPFGTGPRLLLFGAGHVAQPTAKLAKEVGFNVTVHDSRVEWASRERFPGVLIKTDELDKLAEALETTDRDFIAVMTHSHELDYQVAKRVIRKAFYYFGVIGSPRKAAEIRKMLHEDGFSEKEIARMTCPIGIDIGSHTPAEIAVSITAQLVDLHRKWEKNLSK